ncbi:hypothetical protein OH492_29235 [Vibrio chagasii]|nr:hypothetical protein [Vibrio chagasii]
MSYNTATHTYHGTDVFEVKVADNHGGESSKFITLMPTVMFQLCRGNHRRFQPLCLPIHW